MFLIAVAAASATAQQASAATRAPHDIDVLLRSMNAERLASGLRPLHLDRRLCELAYEHAADMKRRKYLSHSTPEGLSPFARMDALRIRYGYAGEILALDQDVRTIFWDFWNSPEHRANMLEPHYVHVGIASVEVPFEGVIVVEDFSD
jgi:uncharacterized protein YkwD